MKSIKIAALILALILTFALFSCSGKDQGQADGTAADGETPAYADALYGKCSFTDLVSFSAQTSDGKTVTNEDTAKYDLTIINIWSTTCPPCITEMPALAEFEKSLPDNICFMTYCLDGQFYADTLKEILEDSGYEGITLVSSEGDLMTLYSQLMYTPTTVFFDRYGKMVAEEMIGASRDPVATYTEYVNNILSAMGLETLS